MDHVRIYDRHEIYKAEAAQGDELAEVLRFNL